MAGARKLSSLDVRARKGDRRLSMMVAYDYPIARLVERAGIELILVGDSVGMTMLGFDSPIPVTVDHIVHHAQAVRRGAPDTHIVADLPFLSYHLSDEQALSNAGRLIQEAGADAVKLEGGSETIAARIRLLVSAGIAVMGHIGLTPQSGGTEGFGTAGADAESARRILAEARRVADAGAYAIVIEAVPRELAAAITAAVPAATIGIGAGPDCDGQIVASTDMLGIESKLFLNFAKRYANIGEQIESAFRAYVDEVVSGEFPGPGLWSSLPPDVRESLDRNGAGTDE
jgi:3-methyl-2-oxobutanoate hydroxymethyltransferase